MNLRTESVVRSYDILTSNGYKCGFIDVTKWAYEWYSLDWSLPMGGFMIKYSNESYNDYNAIISGDSGKDSNLWPTLILRYEI